MSESPERMVSPMIAKSDIESELAKGHQTHLSSGVVSQLRDDRWIAFFRIPTGNVESPLTLSRESYFPTPQRVRLKISTAPELDTWTWLAENVSKPVNVFFEVEGCDCFQRKGRVIGPLRERVDFTSRKKLKMAGITLESRIDDESFLSASNQRNWFGSRDEENEEWFHANNSEVVESLAKRDFFVDDHALRYSSLNGRKIIAVLESEKFSLSIKSNGKWHTTWNGKRELKSVRVWRSEENVYLESFIDENLAIRALSDFVLRDDLTNLVDESLISEQAAMGSD